jgi:hypothetical protein
MSGGAGSFLAALFFPVTVANPPGEPQIVFDCRAAQSAIRRDIECQRTGSQIGAAMIFARPDFVKPLTFLARVKTD